MIRIKGQRRFVCFALIGMAWFWLGGASAGHAQTALATLNGQVFDPSGGLVSGADVLATNTDRGVATDTKTNGAGIYLLSALQPGHYRITVNKQGFRQTELTGITLQIADAATQNIHLEVGAASETVTVEGNGININTTDATVSTVIDREFVDALPLNGRSLQNLVLLAPGVVATSPVPAQTTGNGFSVNGNRDSGSADWTVDGVSANVNAGNPTTFRDALTPGTTVLGTTQSLISLDALQEFRVSTSSYSVEYGVAPGAQIQFQSRAGTNRLHGSAFDYVRNTAFDANDWFANNEGLKRATEHQNDFGGTLGGPIRIPHLYNGSDKAFFFFNYEGLRLLQPLVLSANSSPTAAFRQSAPAAMQPLLNALPLPNGLLYGNGWGQWNGSFSEPSTINSLSVRGDDNLSRSTKLFARFSDSPSSESSIANGYGGTEQNSMRTATVGVTTMFSPSLTNDLHFNFTRSTSGSNFTPMPPTLGSNPSQALAALTPPAQFKTGGYEVAATFSDPSFGGDPSIYNLILGSTLHQWNVVDTLTRQAGSHQLKAGFEWNLHTSSQLPTAYVVYYEFTSLASINASIPSEVEVISAPNLVNTIIPRSAYYVGDTWKVNQRLSVDYGVRWELPFAPHYSNGIQRLVVTSIADPTHPTFAEKNQLYNTSYHNFAPRLGVAYLLRDAGRFQTVLRTGGGLFYSTETSTLLGAGPGFPYSLTTVLPAGTAYPVPTSYLTPPPANGSYTAAQLATQVINGITPNLALPRVAQWNFTIEQQLGASQSLTVGYVGSAGRQLLTGSEYFPAGIKDTPFVMNGTISNYEALQLKLNRRLAHGLQSLVSYTWGHSLDNNSANAYTYAPVYGNSSFDIRDDVSAATVYSLPGIKENRELNAVTTGWALSENFNAYTGTPVSVQGGFYPTISGNDNPYVFLNVIPGQSIYLHGSQYPGGTRLNPAAFSSPPTGQTGDSGRNQFRNQGFWQADTALQRQFALGEKAGLFRLRIDAFNVFNHPNFGYYSASAFGTVPVTFGLATRMINQQNSTGTISPLYGSGGPRSLQMSLRYQF